MENLFKNEITFADIFYQMVQSGKIKLSELIAFELANEEEKKVIVDEFIKKHITFE